MLFMVIERFPDPALVYARFAERGRMLPDGVTYIDSWVEPDRRRCFQLMSCADVAGLREWARSWDDIVEFEFIPVVRSSELSSAGGQE
jgi:Protein of unknown function (DUF3303)